MKINIAKNRTFKKAPQSIAISKLHSKKYLQLRLDLFTIGTVWFVFSIVVVVVESVDFSVKYIFDVGVLVVFICFSEQSISLILSIPTKVLLKTWNSRTNAETPFFIGRTNFSVRQLIFTLYPRKPGLSGYYSFLIFHQKGRNK